LTLLHWIFALALVGLISGGLFVWLRQRWLRMGLARFQAQSALVNELTARRIAADIHDGPAQSIAFSLIKLELAAQDLEAQPSVVAQTRKDLTAVINALRTAANELRHIAVANVLPDLDGATLRGIVETAIDQFSRLRGHAVETDFSIDPQTPAPTNTIRTVVFRVVQEGLSNAAKHAGGEGIRVTLTTTAHDLALTVVDAGPGFDFDAPAAEGHLGLQLMRERVSLVGGTLTFFNNQPSGAGFTVRLTMPT